jgi:hypothetical protein
MELSGQVAWSRVTAVASVAPSPRRSQRRAPMAEMPEGYALALRLAAGHTDRRMNKRGSLCNSLW